MSDHSCFMHPNFGFGLDLGMNAKPAPLPDSDRQYLRGLAAQVLEIANQDRQEQKRNEWYRHNALKPGRPMVLIHPEIAWREMIPEKELKIGNTFFRQWEFFLKQLIYRDEWIDDDFVVEPRMAVPALYNYQPLYAQIDFKALANEDELPMDVLDCLDPASTVCSYNSVETERRYAATQDVLGGILDLAVFHDSPVRADHAAVLIQTRGVEQVMLDLYENPEWIHRFMDLYTQSLLCALGRMEQNGLFSYNDTNQVIAPNYGGMSYVEGLRKSESTPGPANLWASSEAQDLAEISPGMFDEFVLSYQKQVVETFGLSYFGCCESMEQRFDQVKTISNLRKVSVSAWCDPAIAAAALTDQYILSWKPSALMLTGTFDERAVREYIRNAVHAAAGSHLEITLNALMTLNNDPKRLTKWVQIVREETDF